MTKKRRRRTRGAAEIDPNRYSPTTSPNRITSLHYALEGCGYMLRHQKNTRILAAATFIIVPLAIWLGINTDQWAILILTVGSVWVAEFLNAAIEAAVNLSQPKIHPMAKVAKDVAAAGVLITAFAAVLIGLLIFGPPLLDWLNASAAAS